MNASFYIAKRYLFSKKSTNAINIISGISMLGVFVGSAALIIILSVFNGFETLVLSMYNTLTPDLRIEPATGKTFDPETTVFASIRKDPEVLTFTQVLREKVLLRYDHSQFIGQVKGVSADFLKNRDLDSTLLQGNFVLQQDSSAYAVIGSVVQYTLGVNVNDEVRMLEIYAPSKSTAMSFGPSGEFVSRYFHPVGVFEAQQEENDEVIIPLKAARQLLSEPRDITAVEIELKDPGKTDAFQKTIQQQLGENFLVKNRIQQNALLYKILNTEKWAVYLILTFVLIIAIFNIIGSLTMLVIDKRQDIAVLTSLGASKRMIRRIFLLEGMMLSMLGCIVGIAAGTVFCLLQRHYGFISMGQDNMLVNAYPVAFKISDYFLVFLTVFVIAFVASLISSRISVKRFEKLRDDL